MAENNSQKYQNNALAKFLTEKMKEKNISVVFLSRETGISRATINRYRDFTKYPNPDFQNICAIALELHLNQREYQQLIKAAYPWLELLVESIGERMNLAKFYLLLEENHLPLINQNKKEK